MTPAIKALHDGLRAGYVDTKKFKTAMLDLRNHFWIKRANNYALWDFSDCAQFTWQCVITCQIIRKSKEWYERVGQVGKRGRTKQEAWQNSKLACSAIKPMVGRAKPGQSAEENCSEDTNMLDYTYK